MADLSEPFLLYIATSPFGFRLIFPESRTLIASATPSSSAQRPPIPKNHQSASATGSASSFSKDTVTKISCAHHSICFDWMAEHLEQRVARGHPSPAYRSVGPTTMHSQDSCAFRRVTYLPSQPFIACSRRS